jgi:hypothetical protein
VFGDDAGDNPNLRIKSGSTLMSEPSVSPDPAKPSLQFDTAEFADAESQSHELSCTACRRPVAESYFEVGGQKMCPSCKDAFVNARSGSGVAAFFRAWLYGALAGIAGCGLYYAVLALSGYEVGLIAIVVGLMVGFAVRNGSRARGGWLYQAMAMIITYGSIVTSYVPQIVSEINKAGGAEPNPALQAVMIVFAWVFSWFAPFLGLPQNLIGCLIIGFGVYEAWKINKRVAVAIVGPFAVSASNATVLQPPEIMVGPPALPASPS